MRTGSYGYQIPEDGDKGNEVFPALVDDLEQLDEHDHDGVNSAALTRTAMASTTQSLSAGDWSATSGGNYRQLVAMPAGLLYNTMSMTFRLANGDPYFPTVEKVSSTSFYVYINDNTQDVTVLYG